MPSFSDSPLRPPVPPAIRPIVRGSIAAGLVLIVALLAEFQLFKIGEISGVGFGLAIAVTIAVQILVCQLLRKAARKRGGELSSEEKSSLNDRCLKALRHQKQLNTVLLSMFSVGALAVVTNVILNDQSAAFVLVPVALLGFGIWYRRALNRATETLEQKIRIDTLRGQ